MLDLSSTTNRLLESVAPYVTCQPGSYGIATPLPRLTVWSSTHPTPSVPGMFKPMFYAVLQGVKALTIGGQEIRLSAGTCAASSFGLPYVSQLADASRSAPFVALGLDLDVDLLGNVMLDMPKAEDRWSWSAAGGTLDGSIGKALTRFVGLLSVPEDCGILGRHYEAELYYRLLQSPMGDTLRQLGRRDSRSRKIKVAADWLIANAEKPIVIVDLAASAGMSLTSFHRHFKSVTGYSPLAFQRHARLLGAKRLLTGGGLSVTQVAYAVGYISPSQFSREYKSLFGVAPVRDLRGSLTLVAE